MLCRLSEFLNLPHQHFKLHSLRVGGSSQLHLSGIPVHKIKGIGRWSSDAFKRYIYMYISIIAVTNKIWFIGDRLMTKAFLFLMQHKDRFLQVADFDGYDTRFSESMLLEHVPAMVLDMINHYKYLAELVVVNAGTLANIANNGAILGRWLSHVRLSQKKSSDQQTHSGAIS